MWNVWYVVIAATLILVAGIVWYKIDECSNAPSTLVFIGGAVLFISTIILVLSPLSAKQEIREFEYTKQMVCDSVKSGTESQNYAVTSSVLK